VKRDEFDLRTEIINSGNYRIHSASHEGRVVVVKIFGGPHAKQVPTFFDIEGYPGTH
jgi:hypothetical protein